MELHPPGKVGMPCGFASTVNLQRHFLTSFKCFKQITFYQLLEVHRNQTWLRLFN